MITMKSKTWMDEKGVRKAVKEASVKPIYKAAASVRTEAIRSMKGGRKAPSKGAKPEPVPSVAPAPPHRQTSVLANSIQIEMDGTTARIGPTVKYGRIHEFGGLIPVTAKMRGYLLYAFGWSVKADAIHMPARPYMRPALARAKVKFAKLFRNLPLASTKAGRRLNARKG